MSHRPEAPTGVSITRLSQRARLVDAPHIEPRRTSAEALRLAGVRDGDSLTAADLTCLLSDAEPTAAMNRALRLLGHRERSRGELVARLHEDGYPDRLILETLQRLEDLEYLDDERFAGSFVRTKRSSGWSRRRIERGLHEKRVDPELIGKVLDAEVPHAAEEDRALASLDRTDVGDPVLAARALRRLLSRGFSRSVSLSAIARKQGSADDSGKIPQS